MQLPRLRHSLALLHCLALLSAVVTYGAVETINLAFVVLLVHLCLFIAVGRYGLPRATRRFAWTALGVSGAVALWTLLQTLPLPGGFWPNAAWLEVPGVPTLMISVAPADDRIALLKVFLPFSAFVLTLVLFDTDERALLLLKVLVAGAALLAVLTLLQYFVSPGSLVFGSKRAYRDSFTGTFVNRNTAATFFGTAALVSLALCLRRMSRIDVSVLRHVWESGSPFPPFMAATLRRAFAHVLVLGVLVVALVLTKSRAGIGVFLIAMAFFLFLRVRHRLRARAGMIAWAKAALTRRGLLALGAGLVVLSLLAPVLFGQVLLRAGASTRPEERFCMLPSILTAIGDHLPTGAGLASFRPLFPGYRDAGCGIEFVWDMAHNVYLEGTLALGFLFPVLLLVVIAGLVSGYVRGRRSRRRYRFAPDLGLATLLLVLLHSSIDFSLQIPGFALYFAVTCAALLTLSQGGDARRKRAAPI